MAEPYITVDDVTDYLDGVTLDGAQSAVAQQKVDAAIAYANRTTLQAWNLDPITGEEYMLRSRRLRLRSFPVTSVEQIQVRTMIVGDTLQPLTAGMDYELLNPAQGIVLLAGRYGRGTLALIDYTPDRPVPADVVEAVTMIAAHSLYQTLNLDRWGLTKAQAQGAGDQRVLVEYAGMTDTLDVPTKAERILTGYRPMLWG